MALCTHFQKNNITFCHSLVTDSTEFCLGTNHCTKFFLMLFVCLFVVICVECLFSDLLLPDKFCM